LTRPHRRKWQGGVSAERRILPLHFIFLMAAFSRKPLRFDPRSVRNAFVW
jgi:hypothetical protein